MLRSLGTIALILLFQCASLCVGLAILAALVQVLALLDWEALVLPVWGLGFLLLSFALTVRLVRWLDLA